MQPPPYGSAPMYGGLRPLDVGETLDHAIQVYRRNFLALVKMTAVVVVPLAVVTVLVQLSSRPSQQAASGSTTIGNFTFSNSSNNGHQSAVHLGASLAVLAIALLASRLAVGVCTRGVADAYVGGKPAEARTSLGVFGRNLHSLLWIELLTLPAIMVASVFCFAPGIWLWVSWLVASPALLVEGTKGTKALRRSFTLVSGRRWPILGLGIIATLLAEVVRFSFALVLIGVLLRSHSTASTSYIVAAGVIGAISALLTTPLIAVAYVIVYFDLRVRNEGFDLQIALAGLDQPGPPPAAPPPPPPASWPPPPSQPPPPAPRPPFGPTS